MTKDISFTGSIGVLFFLSITPVSAQGLAPEQVFNKVRDSVVVLKVLNARGKQIRSGSGVLISEGRVATNCHVMEGNIGLWVCRGKHCVTALMYEEDGNRDICILDANGIGGTPAGIVTSAGVKVGDPVYAVGAPGGRELSLSKGTVTHLRGGHPPFFIQTTAAVSQGSSGGGLFDGEGRLLGLTTIKMEGGQSMSFAMTAWAEGERRPDRKTAVKGSAYTGWLTRSIELEKAKETKRLLDWCRKWTKSNPESVFAWYGLGSAYSRLNRHEEAIEAYLQARSLDPGYVEAAIGLGNTYSILSRHDEAIGVYREALGKNPEYEEAWFNLGNVYVKLNHYEEAIEAYRESLRINPKNAPAWNNLGFSYGNLKRHEEAVEAFQQHLLLKPDASAWENLVIAYSLSGNRDAALDALQRLQRLYPDKAEKLMNRMSP
jgi:cytochrome c-type biogenesis protein CcmH/NrfG